MRSMRIELKCDNSELNEFFREIDWDPTELIQQLIEIAFSQVCGI